MLSDLLDFVRTRNADGGASFSEIKGYLEIEDKVECHNLIEEAVNKNLLTFTGERRGKKYQTRNSVTGATVTDDNGDLPYIDNKALETYLTDPTPVHDAIITHIENIVKFKEPINLLQFIQNGRTIKTYTINFDHEKKKNVISDVSEMIRMNYFVIRIQDLSIEKVYQITGQKDLLEYPEYEELREDLRLMLK